MSPVLDNVLYLLIRFCPGTTEPDEEPPLRCRREAGLSLHSAPFIAFIWRFCMTSMHFIPECYMLYDAIMNEIDFFLIVYS